MSAYLSSVGIPEEATASRIIDFLRQSGQVVKRVSDVISTSETWTEVSERLILQSKVILYLQSPRLSSTTRHDIDFASANGRKIVCLRVYPQMSAFPVRKHEIPIELYENSMEPWKRLIATFPSESSFLKNIETVNNALELKPNIGGIGVNINALIARYVERTRQQGDA